MFSRCVCVCVQVKRWITINEPWVVSVKGYGTGDYAPGLTDLAEGPYISSHNLIKAHAEAYHVYRDNHFDIQKGDTLGLDRN